MQILGIPAEFSTVSFPLNNAVWRKPAASGHLWRWSDPQGARTNGSDLGGGVVDTILSRATLVGLVKFHTGEAIESRG